MLVVHLAHLLTGRNKVQPLQDIEGSKTKTAVLIIIIMKPAGMLNKFSFEICVDLHTKSSAASVYNKVEIISLCLLQLVTCNGE